MRPLNYGSSFVCHSASFNAVRFLIESRTRVVDTGSGYRTDFYQCASCKSEHTFAARNLFPEDNYDFLPVFGGGHLLIFRRPVREDSGYRQVTRCRDVWGPPRIRKETASKARRLATWEEIREVTMEALAIVTQTEICNEETGLKAIIECPTKTMNLSLEKQMFQVDTGLIAFPDLGRRYESQIACLSLAYLAFNSPDSADS